MSEPKISKFCCVFVIKQLLCWVFKKTFFLFCSILDWGGVYEFLSILIINIFYKIPVFYIKVDKNLCIITKRVCNNTMN